MEMIIVKIVVGQGSVEDNCDDDSGVCGVGGN